MKYDDAIRYAVERIESGFCYEPDMADSRALCFADATSLVDRYILTDEQRIDSANRSADRPLTHETSWQDVSCETAYGTTFRLTQQIRVF